MGEGVRLEERAWMDALAEAVKGGLRGDEALEHAEALRKTAWFQWSVLRHALRDAGRAVIDAFRKRL